MIMMMIIATNIRACPSVSSDSHKPSSGTLDTPAMGVPLQCVCVCVRVRVRRDKRGPANAVTLMRMSSFVDAKEAPRPLSSQGAWGKQVRR